MKVFKSFLFFLLLSNALIAQPTWSVNPSDYQYSMTIITELNVNGSYLRSTNDIIGAFSNGVCRGVTKPIYNAERDKYFAYLTVFSNSPGDVIEFKIYDSSTGLETQSTRTLTFAPDSSVGSQFQSLVIADPPLRNEAELISFGFEGVDYNALDIDGFTLNFFIDGTTYDITQLDPVFSVSPGASVYINQVEQSSTASETLDFTENIVYQVMSEDKTILNEFTIVVTQPVSSGPSAGSGGASVSLGGGSVSLGGATVITQVVTVTTTTATVTTLNTGGSGGSGGGGGGSSNERDFIITESEGTTIVSEDGLSDIIVVNITSRPYGDVVIDVEISDTTEVELSTNRIVFDKDDWSTPQFLTVNGIDDALTDGNSLTELRFLIVDSLSYNPYDNLEDKFINVLNIDDESLPNFTLSQVQSTTVVNETGTSEQIGVSLTATPTAEVVINISSSSLDELRLSVTSLLFDASNWNIEQFVTVQGIDDNEDDGDQAITLSFEIAESTVAEEYLDVPSLELVVINENVYTPPEVPKVVFYKKDAVCYNGGAIKVVYPIENTLVSLNLNGQQIAQKTIINGEVIFTDLEEGSYVVGISDIVKIVNVGLDE